MFDLMPFERKDNSLFRYFDDFDRSFFGGLQNMWPSCQTDIVWTRATVISCALICRSLKRKRFTLTWRAAA